QVDPSGSILCMGPPLSSAAILPIARLGRALCSCLPRASGARHYFFPPRARGARRFSDRRAALGAARCPTLPVMRPAARGGALPVARPGAHGGFVARGARARPEGRQKGAARRPLPSSSRPCPALPPCPGPALPGSALLPPLLQPYPVLGFGGGEWGVAGVWHPLLLLLIRLPLLQLPLRGVVRGKLGGGSRRVASSASSPEATISGSPASLLR
ncbi:unnamed protein product, partial [Closterium sp. NIES-53]